MVAEFDKIDRWQLRFGKRRPGCKWRSSFSRKTHCDMFPLWITIRGSKISCLHLLELLILFFLILKFCSLQQRWRSDSLLGVCWLGSGEKSRSGGRYWWRGGIGLTFIVFIVFGIWYLYWLYSPTGLWKKNSTRMAILMKRNNEIYKSTNNTFTPPPHPKENS